MATPKLELSLRLKSVYGPEAAPVAVLAATVKVPGQENVYDELHLMGDLAFSWPIDLSLSQAVAYEQGRQVGLDAGERIMNQGFERLKTAGFRL